MGGCNAHPLSSQNTTVVDFKVLKVGNWSAYTKRQNIIRAGYLVFTNQEQWVKFWSGESRIAPAKVDFNNYFVLYITLGQKKSGGYAVSVREVLVSCDRDDDSKVSIVLELDEPAPGAGVDLGETSPFVIAKIQMTCLKDISYSQLHFIQKYNSQYTPVDMQFLRFD